MSRIKYECAEYSSLFRTVKGLLYVRGGLAFRVTSLDVRVLTENDIGNYQRVRDKIYSTIQFYYTYRIDEYDLAFDFEDNSSNLQLLKIRTIDSKPGKSIESFSGESEIFPKTFVCTSCGDFITEPNFKNISKKCQKKVCSGIYKQVSVVKFCEKCGIIEPLYYKCQNDSSHRVELIRGQADDIFTWNFRCSECKGEPKDILGWSCDHKERRTKTTFIENAKGTKFKTLTVGEGSVFLPVVITMIDLPKSNSITSSDLDYIALAVSLKLIKDPDDDSKYLSLKEVDEYYNYYNSSFARKRAGKGMSDEEWKESCGMTSIFESIEVIKSTLQRKDIDDAVDFFALSGVLTNRENIRSYTEYMEKLNDHAKQKVLKVNFDKIKNEFKIQDIHYISSVRLLSANIGYIRGTNKFYEEKHVAHFEPIWKDERRREIVESYLHPFDTEGLIINFNSRDILQWLENNELAFFEEDDLADPDMTLLGIDSALEGHVHKLLHTVSHHLIKASSSFTGIDSDSCGEMIFPKNGAIFIFSINTVNIGGFKYLFENSIFDWFNKLKVSMKECIYDPMCNNNEGVCFSCSYLSEFVCCNFNKNLDRDIFIAENRYKKGFWKDE